MSTATKLSDIFPTEPCRRCGGTGHYSYNQRHGSMCYGCNGQKVAYTKAAQPFVNEMLTAMRRAKEPTASQLQPGDTIAVSADGRFTSARKAKGTVWVTVAAVESTGEECGWSKTGDKVTAVYHYHLVHFTAPEDDGSAAWADTRGSVKVSANQVVRRLYRFESDPTTQDILARWAESQKGPVRGNGQAEYRLTEEGEA